MSDMRRERISCNFSKYLVQEKETAPPPRTGGGLISSGTIRFCPVCWDWWLWQSFWRERDVKEVKKRRKMDTKVLMQVTPLILLTMTSSPGRRRTAWCALSEQRGTRVENNCQWGHAFIKCNSIFFLFKASTKFNLSSCQQLIEPFLCFFSLDIFASKN